ncbi:MAG: helix-turn-helix transcriptional regulator, partial [Clostridiaceae bacterium]|nr:helix-turn-helix transcriptional regulator [Clostridiaceae bacterium]
YNVQTAVDKGSHLIADYEVTNHNTDQGLLLQVAEKVKETLETETLELDDISNKFFISKNYLCILFKKNLGITCSHYITKEKMKYAEKLMRTTRLTCYQISNAVGYKDYFYFSRVFKKVFGCSPKEYQMRIWRETYEKTD